MNSKYVKEYLLTPEYCDLNAAMSPLAASTIFQAVASIHAEEIGVGGHAMAERGEFWLTVHTRIDFLKKAYLMDNLVAETWPETSDAKSIRSFRSYVLKRGDETIACGKTQWAILGPQGKIMRFGDSCFPQDFPFLEGSAIQDAPLRFVNDFVPEDYLGEYTVQSTDIDFGKHMNNIAYLRAIFNQFPSTKIAGGNVKSMEIHYNTSALEGAVLKIYQKVDGPSHRIAIMNEEMKPYALALITFNE